MATHDTQQNQQPTGNGAPEDGALTPPAGVTTPPPNTAPTTTGADGGANPTAGAPQPDGAGDGAGGVAEILSELKDIISGTQNKPAEGEGTPSEPSGDTTVVDGVEVDSLGYAVSIDDPDMNAITAYFKAKGIKSDAAYDIFSEAIETGDPSKINEEALAKALGADDAFVVSRIAKSVMMERAAEQAKIIKAVHDSVGGEEAWNIIRDWSNTKASVDPEFAQSLDRYASLLDKGDEYAHIVGAALKSLYNESTASKHPRGMIGSDKVFGTASHSAILDITEFGKLASAAVSRGDMEEYKNVLARWRSGGGRTLRS